MTTDDTPPPEGTPERPWARFERLCAQPDETDPEVKGRPSPPVPAAEDDAVEHRLVTSLRTAASDYRAASKARGTKADLRAFLRSAATHLDGLTNDVAAALDAAGVLALAARDLARADARMVRAERDEARQQVADLRAVAESCARSCVACRSRLAALAGDTTEAGAEPYPGFRQEREGRWTDPELGSAAAPSPTPRKAVRDE